MGISGSLSNALSGLTAAARAAEVISANVSNALTEGYGRRELELTSNSLGGNGAGVSVQGVYRSVDHQAIGQRRLAEASLGEHASQANFLLELKTAIGLPDDPASLTGRLSQLEAVLIEAVSRPDAAPRLAAALDAAEGLTRHINSASDRIQTLRMEADQEINRQVVALNDGLSKVAAINHSIRLQLGAGNDASALMDQRQQIVDALSTIVPLREVPRDNGQIALFTPGGAILLDGKAASVSFAPVGVIVPQMTLGTAALSGVAINGQAISTSDGGPMSGGSLSGLFAVRDEYATVAQEQLDAVARDLIERFADPAVDTSILPTDPGIFTDAGGVFSATNEIGLSARLSINNLIVPSAGGELRRIRDGLGASVPGSVGDATTLQALVNALSTTRVPLSGGFMGAARSATGLAGDFISLINVDLRSAESDKSFALAQFDALKALELQSGVDTDHELQKLLLVERAYSANARVMSTVDEMIQTLLGI